MTVETTSIINGTNSADDLIGTNADDTINGLDGNDTIDGNEGNDSLNGGSHNDLYIFNDGDGKDIIYDFHGHGGHNAGVDTLKFGTGLTQADLSYSGSGKNIIISFTNTNDQITLKEQTNINNRIENFEFANGSTLTYSDVASQLVTRGTDEDEVITGSQFAESIYGGLGYDTITTVAGNDTVYGEEGNDSISGNNYTEKLYGGTGKDTILGYDANDTLSGGKGDDSLNGGSHNDLYIFNQADGKDIIYDFHAHGGHNAGLDTLQFGAGITQADLSYKGSGNNIIIEFAGSSDQITLKEHTNINNRIEYFEFENGSTLIYSDIASQLATRGTDADEIITGSKFSESIYGGMGYDTITTNSGNDTVYGGEGSDHISGNNYSEHFYGGTGNDTILGYDGNDRLSGDNGNDSLNGGSHNDLYIFNQGDGQDIIYDFHSHGGHNAGLDTLQFGAGITQADLSYKGSGNNIIIEFAGSSDQITLKEHTNINNRIEFFEFDDASKLMYSDIVSQLATRGTDADEIITGSKFSESIYGGLGYDTITTNSGNDTVYGEEGNDHISGNNYSEKFYGGTGYDTLLGYDGNDTLSGDKGNDSLNGGAHDDRYIFNKEDGQDIIYDFHAHGGYNAGLDTLQFGAAISHGDLSYRGSGNNIIIEFANSSDQITLKEQTNINNQIEHFRFADDSILLYSDISSQLATIGTDADEVITGSKFSESIYGGLGYDTITTNAGNDTVYGGEGKDYISGSNYSEKLFGGTGNDTLMGYSGNDRLSGDKGNDSLNGGYNDDLYIFNQGDGQDIIHDFHSHGGYNAGFDTLRFGAGITESNTVFTNIGGDLEITFTNSVNDKITVLDHYSNINNKIEHFEYINNINGDANDNKLIGTSKEDLIKGLAGADTLIGSNGDDNLNGGADNDILLGDQGMDTLTGELGDDIYVINDTNDVVNESANQGDDTVYTSLNSYTIGANIENIVLTGYKYDNATQNFVVAGKGLSAIGNSLNNSIVGNNLNNRLIGKQGDDVLEGGTGNDSYIFYANDGLDLIKDTSGTDKIYFESASIKNTAIFYKDASNLYIDYGTTEGTDQITVEGKDSIERIELSSGEYLTNDDINQLIQNVISYANDNSISVSSFDDVRNNSELMNIVTTAWN